MELKDRTFLRVGDPTFLLDEEELVDVVPSIDPTFYLFLMNHFGILNGMKTSWTTHS
jgi:hypothetical protein